MISEYAILSDVFDPGLYSSPEVCDLRLCGLRDCLLSQGVVRNLHGGQWWSHFEQHRDRWHQRAKELVKKLKQQGRLCESVPCRDVPPCTAAEWCEEAIASHNLHPYAGIIADEQTASTFKNQSIVASVSRLSQASWWNGGSNSVSLQRTSEDYIRVLGSLLQHSRSLMFIDPHLNPSLKHYAEFTRIIEACGTLASEPKPTIEVHRVCYIGSGRDRVFPNEQEWRDIFAKVGGAASERGIELKVYFWDDFHDRYIISNLAGILMPNGMDVDQTLTRWALLDREHKDSVQLDFDVTSRRHTLRFSFSY